MTKRNFKTETYKRQQIDISQETKLYITNTSMIIKDFVGKIIYKKTFKGKISKAEMMEKAKKFIDNKYPNYGRLMRE